MLMICWFYCIPFAKLFYFAFGPLLFIFSLFVLKRGIRTARRGLRQFSFLLMFFAAIKLFIFDIRMAEYYLFCEKNIVIPWMGCSKKGFMVAEFAGILLLFLSSAVLFNFYRLYLPNKKPKLKTPEQVGLRFWANFGMVMVIVMAGWTMAPWVGALTVGSVPKIFTVLKWSDFALVNMALLLVGFWKVESCEWERVAGTTTRSGHHIKTWTPRDTLWTNVFIYAVTLALSYVSHDLLVGHMQVR